MKKILYTIGLLMMATAVLKPVISIGAENESYDKDETYSNSAMLARLLPSAMSENMFESFGQTGDSGAVDITENEAEKVGKDLYLRIWKKTIADPENQALKNTAGRFGISQNDMEFIRSGSLGPLVAKGQSLDQDRLIRKATDMRNRFIEEQKRLSLRADIEAATLPSEVFANGDLSDSGFDLISDLEIIEKLLFLKSDPIDIGKAYNKEKSSEEEQTPPAPGEAVTTPETAPPQGEPQGAPPVGGGAGGTQQTGTQQAAGTQEECPEGFEEAPVVTSALQPNCTDASEVQKVIDAYEKAKGLQKKNCVPKGAAAGEAGAGTQQGGGTGETPPGGGAAGGGGVSPEAIVTDDFLPEVAPPETPPVEPAPADNWKKERICLGKFCLFINFYYETPTSAYMDADNCIACHIEKIDDLLKKVLSHSISPNKVPGNLIETPKCKNGASIQLSAISMNWNVQFMPIKTPINDDLILGSSINNDWKYFCDATAFFPASMCKVDPPTQEIKNQELPSLEGQVSKRLLSNLPETIAYDTVINNMDKDIQAILGSSQEAAQKVEAERSVSPSIMMYKALLAEIDHFYLYFLNINDLIRALHEKVQGITGEQACVNFKNKKTCT